MVNIISSGSKFSKITIHIFLGLLALFCLLPLVFVISISFSNEKDIIRNGYAMFPRVFSLEAYRMLLKEPGQLLQSYAVTTFISVIGSISALTISSMIAYVLTRKDFKASRIITFMIFFPLLFQSGLVPFYIYVVKFLNLKNTLTILIIPYLVIPWLVLLLKGFIAQIPKSVIESGWLDGASEVTIFFKIIAPMSKAALATVGLFYFLTFWNDWWLSLLFITENSKLPLQLLLQRLLSNAEFMRSAMFQMASVNVDLTELPTDTARMATALLVAGPILIVFPFFQRYLVRGISVGSIKG
jgi:putative aldouronate transport system permease protein